MDTNGVERLVVIPFESSGNRRQIAGMLTQIFRTKINDTGMFKMVEYTGYRPGSGMEDAVFTGTVTGYTVRDSSRQVERTRKARACSHLSLNI
jgi:hypothetical protein